jgi:putative FmdB family regulatory protein
MPTYEYECRNCGRKFEQWQAITEAPLMSCPECRGEVRRLVSGGAGFIIKVASQGQVSRHGGECSLEQGGKTCCGQDERCGKPPCGGKG